MKTIQNYELKFENIQYINMPKGAEILSVEIVDDTPTLFYLADTSNNKEERVFGIYEESNKVSKNVKFIGTFQIRFTKNIYHLFEIKVI